MINIGNSGLVGRFSLLLGIWLVQEVMRDVFLLTTTKEKSIPDYIDLVLHKLWMCGGDAHGIGVGNGGVRGWCCIGAVDCVV